MTSNARHSSIRHAWLNLERLVARLQAGRFFDHSIHVTEMTKCEVDIVSIPYSGKVLVGVTSPNKRLLPSKQGFLGDSFKCYRVLLSFMSVVMAMS